MGCKYEEASLGNTWRIFSWKLTSSDEKMETFQHYAYVGFWFSYEWSESKFQIV